MMPRPKLIADDYGLGQGHDTVMRDLIAAGAIDGVSVLVSDLFSINRARLLLDLRSKADFQIGLHLNLTQSMSGLPLATPITRLLAKSLTGQLNSKKLTAQLSDQCAIFEGLFGQKPDHIDGHQHCHILPGLRDWAIDRANSYAIPIRSPAPAGRQQMHSTLARSGVKSLPIMFLGQSFRRRVLARGVQTNADFAGIIRLDRVDGYEAAFDRMLASAPSGSLMMVHPGDANDAAAVEGHPNALRAIEAQRLRVATAS
jgi:predicted glycoside hydrolase/deacetylase ChbG (UPF0249 family)